MTFAIRQESPLDPRLCYILAISLPDVLQMCQLLGKRLITKCSVVKARQVVLQ